MKKILPYFLGILIILLIFILLFFKNNNSNKFVFWSIQLKPIYEKELNQIIKDFETKHPEIKVVWVDIPIQEAQKRTLASILSSTPPDLINLNPDFSEILAQRNVLEFFDENELNQFNPSLLNKLKYEGKVYALPFYATSPVTIYNKKIYDKCKTGDFIKTYDELFLISDDLKKCSKIAPFVLSLNENDTLAKILNSYNISSLKTDKEKQSATKIYMSFDEMYKKGELPKDVLSINHREAIEKYMSNQAIITVAGSNFINMIKQNAPDIYSQSALSQQLTGSNKNYNVSLMNLIIPKKAKNKQLAHEFAYILTNKDNQLQLSKLTNVLPANKYALDDEYFKNCPPDLVEQSRCISAKQLNNLIEKDFSGKNKKAINENINKTLEETLLDKNSSIKTVEEKIENLSKQLQIFMND